MTYDWRNKTIAQQLMSAELLPLFYSEIWKKIQTHLTEHADFHVM